MKILHTSDWHLGRSLYGKKRYEEYTQWFEWLIQTIKEQEIDTLLVSGDIFDTTTPSNKSQQLYYRFLSNLMATSCCQVVIIAGNHDSPTFLAAPKELLLAMNIHIVSHITDNLENEIITLQNENNQPNALVCAVPYLRDKDIRNVEAGETTDDKRKKLIQGISEHFQKVVSLAEKKQQEYQEQGLPKLPIIAMGHLFTTGGKILSDDGVRELYVGSLVQIEKEHFPSSIDYFALGHLHIPQQVAKTKHIRYCGSPIPMGFGEAKQKKQILLIEFENTTPTIQSLPIPCFQDLEKISGTLEEIQNKIDILRAQNSSAWLEIEYTGTSSVSHLRETIDAALQETHMDLCRIKNTQITNTLLQKTHLTETLANLDPNTVFERRLDITEYSEQEKIEMKEAYKEILQTFLEKDSNFE